MSLYSIKSKSISEDHTRQMKIDKKKKHNYYKCIGSISNSQNFATNHNESQKDEELNNTEYFLVNMSKDKKEQRSNSAMLVSDLVCSTPRNASSIIKDKSASPINIDIQKLKNHGLIPHGEEAEKVNNEERLNIQTESSPLKQENQMLYRSKEKSIDLSCKSGSYLYGNHNILTAQLLNNNKLTKYLSNFIGGKDFRPTEERELEKCTFKPNVFVNHRRYKTIKGKISGYIHGENSHEKPKNVSIYLGKSSKSKKNNKSKDRSSSKSDSKYSIITPKSVAYSMKGTPNEIKSKVINPVTKKNFALQISKVCSSGNANLDSVLRFGYTHKYQEKNQYEQGVKPSSGNFEVKSTKILSSPTNAMTISFNDLNKKKYPSSHLITPLKVVKSKRAQSINQHGLTKKLVG